MNRRKWALAAAVAAIVAVGAAGVALAGEDDPPAAATSLVGRVAEKLGIGEDELASAIREAREEQIDESVANGDLSEEEAERLKERLDETPEERLLGPDGPKSDFEFRFAPEPGHDGLNGILGPAMGLLEAAEDLAAFLGISEEQLREELSEDGATLGKTVLSQWWKDFITEFDRLSGFQSRWGLSGDRRP